MPQSEHIVTADERNFTYEVLAFSNQLPVVVDFWADWRQPCDLLNLVLENMAVQAEGAFRLAEINVDENPQLVVQYQIETVPTVKAFRHGQMVAEFSGLRTQAELHEFLRRLAPLPGDLALDKGNSLLARGRWSEAQDSFSKVIQGNPDHPGGLLGLAKTYLACGEATAALPILRKFPASKEYGVAEQLLPLAMALIDLDDEDVDPGQDDELYPMYQTALRLVLRGNLAAAIDGLLEIQRENKKYRQGEARKVTVGLLHLLGDKSPQGQAYRHELSALLF